jgi:hypothetical protein
MSPHSPLLLWIYPCPRWQECFLIWNFKSNDFKASILLYTCTQSKVFHFSL